MVRLPALEAMRRSTQPWQNIVDKDSLMLGPFTSLLGSVSAAINETDTTKFDEVFTCGATIKFNFKRWAERVTGHPFRTRSWPRVSTVLFLGDLEWMRVG